MRVEGSLHDFGTPGLPVPSFPHFPPQLLPPAPYVAQTMTRMKTSVRMMMAPPADAAGEPAMESMKSGAVLDLEEQVGGG